MKNFLLWVSFILVTVIGTITVCFYACIYFCTKLFMGDWE